MVSDVPAPPDPAEAPRRELADAGLRCERLAAENRELRAMAEHLFTAQEEERRVVARGLHNGAGQSITAIRMAAHAALHEDDPERRREELDDILAQADAALAQVRAISVRLRPPPLDALGLEAALRWHAESACTAAGCALELRIEALPRRPGPLLEQTAFRIAQEALANALRHARADTVSVQLRVVDGVLALEIGDNGRGFDPALTGGTGLVTMRERARSVGGSLEIASAPGHGTRVLASLPGRLE